MNIHDIQRYFTLVCATGGIACIAAILLYAARHQLRQLFDRWLALGRLRSDAFELNALRLAERLRESRRHEPRRRFH